MILISKEPHPMKSLLSLALATVIAVGAAQLGSTQAGDKGDNLDNPYIPLKVGTTWEYAAVGKKVTVTVKAHEDVAGSGKCAVLETDAAGGKLTEHLAVKSDGIYRVRANGKDITPPFLVLRFPTKKGEEWQIDSKTENMAITGKLAIAAEEKLKIGTSEYDTVAVKSNNLKMGAQDAILEAWYAKDRGMVKQHFRIPGAGFDITLELEKFTAGK
jgi:hypothetical protein